MTALPFLTPLSPEQQIAFGMNQIAPIAMADRVRFGELDQLAHVNNVEYLRWFESLRVQYFTECGLTSYRKPGVEPRIVIRRGETDYLSEVRQNEVYVATARTRSFRKSSFIMDQDLWVARDGGAVLAARFVAVIVLLLPDGSARWDIPDWLADHFVQADGAEQKS
ncbi:acyl-CoA thioesterase [Thalassococcus lentus]|uniref:Acyl-CoA thioesterase n=1 Tax=Thalassococcus lentus TaxID=1210524 RepID=A0ABT4XRJ9_9RHOB|nr:acyl-CoA thioesterase [Thalassococcus lentus]MDA7424579.1 acyl-CoA thioesterase [Thalassococcus lentus]